MAAKGGSTWGCAPHPKYLPESVKLIIDCSEKT